MSENMQEMEDPSGSGGANSEGKHQPEGMLHLGEQYGAAVDQQILQLAPPQQATTLAVPGPGLQAADPQWVKYYIQRVSTNVNVGTGVTTHASKARPLGVNLQSPWAWDAVEFKSTPAYLLGPGKLCSRCFMPFLTHSADAALL